MAWYDQISKMYDWRDRQVEKAREAGNAARLRRNPDAGPLRPLQLPARRPRYDLNYKPWQRKMVDPNHPAGAVKYGVYPASPAGENMLMGGLAGSLLPLLPMRSIPSVYKPLGRVLPRARITPSISQPSGGTVFRGTRFGKDATLNDLRGSFTRPANAVRPAGPATIQRDRILPRVVSGALRPRLGPHRRVDHSLRGVRPFRGPRGTLGLYKGAKTGQAKPPEGGGINPLKNMREWWRLNNPWM